MAMRQHLPPEVVARLDPERAPVHVEGTMIDGEGSTTQSDAIFRLHLGGGSAVIVYALFEHKSQIDHGTPLQLIRYVLGIWADTSFRESSFTVTRDGRLVTARGEATAFRRCLSDLLPVEASRAVPFRGQEPKVLPHSIVV